MAQFYSLDEAARLLGMSPDDLKQKAQSREIRAFQDRGTWQFKVADVDELARRRGLGSDPDVSLSDLDLPVASTGSGTDDFDLLSEFQIGAASTGSDEHDDLGESVLGTAEGDVRIDDLSLPPELGGSSSTIIGMKPGGKLPTDSDIKLVPDAMLKSASDSDVRLAPAPRPQPRGSDSDVTLVADDSVEIPVVPPTPRAPARPPVAETGGDAGATTMARSPLLDSSDELSTVGGDLPDSNSDFELTPSSVIDALQPDSGSDFELTSLDSSDDEIPAPPKGRPAAASGRLSPSESDVTAVEPSASGVNLMRPSDSGINLAAPSLDLGQGDSIELAPLDDDDFAPPKAPTKPAAQKGPSAASSVTRPAPKSALTQPDDPGATALPMKLGGEKDIFDDTDFEVDALEAGDDRTVQLETGSDFEIDEAESASEVFAIDEDDVDENAATALGAAPALDDDAFAESSSGEVDADGGWGDVSSDEETPATTGGGVATTAAAAATGAAVGAAAGATTLGPRGSLLTTATGPDWHPGWVAAVVFTSILALLGLFVGHDLVVNLNEFRGNGPASGLVSWIAGLMG